MNAHDAACQTHVHFDHLLYMVLGMQAPRIDPESLEQENDRSIEALGERTNLLRQVCQGVSTQLNARTQHVVFCYRASRVRQAMRSS